MNHWCSGSTSDRLSDSAGSNPAWFFCMVSSFTGRALMKLAARIPTLIPRALAGDPTAIATIAATGLLAAYLTLKEKLGK